MNIIYKIGVIIGIIAIYLLVTWGFGVIVNNNEYDDAGIATGAWLAGMILFLILAIFTLEKFGLWMV